MSLLHNIKRIIVSRCDAIGDVVLTLPLCGLIKKHYPEAAIIFIGRTYTEAVISCSEHVDEFVNADELLSKTDRDAIIQLAQLQADVIIHVFPHVKLAKLAKHAGIRYRIGTTNRIFHWGWVNKLVALSRKNSNLHESQLNCKLLEPLGIVALPSTDELSLLYGFKRVAELPERLHALLDSSKKTIVLHPKSHASAREWNLEHFSRLIQLLDSATYNVVISGSEKERPLLANWLQTLPSSVKDGVGRCSLEELIALLSKSHAIVAASTGPLHIGAALGIGAIGIFPPIRPIHPGRWAPIGRRATYLCVSKNCADCKKKPAMCHCINEISPQEVVTAIERI